MRCLRCSSHDGPGVKQPEHDGMPVALVRGFSNEWAGYVHGCLHAAALQKNGEMRGLDRRCDSRSTACLTVA